MVFRLKEVIILALILVIMIPMSGALRDMPEPVPEPIPFEYEGIDYTPPEQVCNYMTNYSNHYCERQGYTQYCVWQTEQDEDYPCTLDGFDIVCEEENALALNKYRARLNRDEQDYYDDRGIVTLDFRVNTTDIYNNSIYTTDFVETGRQNVISLDYRREGFYQVGYNSNVFYYTSFQYGSTTNTSIDVNVTMSNSHIPNSDPLLNGVVGYWQFTEGGEDSGPNGDHLDLIGPTKVHEMYNLDGTDDYMNGPSDLLAENGSMSFWAKVDTLNGNVRILTTDDTVGANGEFRTYANSFSAFYCYWGNGTAVAFSRTQVTKLQQWQHFVCTWEYDGTTTNLTLWNNGELKETGTLNGPTKSGDKASQFGAWNAGGFFDGSFDEFIVWDRTLNGTEINDIYDRGLYVTGEGANSIYDSTIFNAGEVVNWTNFTADITNLSNNNITFKFRTAEFAQYYEGDANLLSYFTFNYIEPVYDKTELLINLNFTSGLVTDSSGNGYDFEILGGTYRDGAYKFDGLNDYLWIDDDDALDFDDKNFSFSIWVRVDATTSETESMRFISKGRDGSLHGWDGIYQPSTDKIQFGNVVSLCSNSNAGMDDNQWHHVVMKYVEGNTREIYVDSVNLTLSCAGGPLPFDDTPSPLTLGARTAYFAPTHLFNGSLDNFLLFNRTLTQTDITELYDQGRHRFNDTVNQQTFNSTLGTDPGAFYGEDAISFGGNYDISDNEEALVLNTDYYKDLFNFTDDTFSINAYVNPIDATINQRDMEIFSYGRDAISDTAKGGYRFYLAELGPGDYRLVFSYVSEAFIARSSACTTNDVQPNTWTQVAVSVNYNAGLDAMNVTLFVNGQECQNSLLVDKMAYAQGTQGYRIMPCSGALGFDCNASTKYFEYVGSIDDLAILSREIYEDEILTYGSYTPSLQIGQDIRKDNSQFLQYLAEFNTNNLTNAPTLSNVSVFYGVDTNLTQAIPDISLTVGESADFNFGPYFNFAQGYIRICSGSPVDSTVVYNNCVATYTVAENLEEGSETYTLTVNNGYGATTANVNLNYTYTNKMQAIQGAEDSMINIIKYIKLVSIILGILFLVLMVVGMMSKNKFKYQKKFVRENLIAIFTTLLIVSGGIWIINMFLLV
mgnify:CR=1 FL=1|jgi:putative hemolysin|tara:strand:- start:2196 stop:5567 length:3372 start_codon:yes stop_codon:yes gene_type:complete